jgi:hypothetical protein
MAGLSQNDLQPLLDTSGGPCVSLFLPQEERSGSARGSTRLKVLLLSAERGLDRWGLKRRVIEELMAPVDELIGDSEFWSRQHNGLGIFCSVGLFRLHSVTPRSPDQPGLPELQVVAAHFHLKPLLPFVARHPDSRRGNATLHDLRQVLPAASRGEVESLFLSSGTQSWGRFSPRTGKIALVEQPSPGDEDLPNLAAIYTLQAHGEAFAVPPQEIPDGAALTAILRKTT